MICDQIAAGQTYLKDRWNESEPLNHLRKRKDKIYINDNIYAFLENFYIYMEKYGIKNALNKKILKKFYDESVIKK